MATGRELPIDERASAFQMAETIFADDVQVVSASYSGDRDSSGIYTNGDSVMPGVAPGNTGVILSTGDADDITQSNGDPNRSSSTSTNTWGQNGNPDFNAAAGAYTYDASYLDVDIIPQGDVLTFQFVFLSEEFPEYQTGIYQDFVGMWINGELVPLSIGDGDVDPNNLNAQSNANLYVDNTGDDYNTEMDGFTVTMSVTIPVNAGEVNSIRIGIADGEHPTVPGGEPVALAVGRRRDRHRRLVRCREVERGRGRGVAARHDDVGAALRCRYHLVGVQLLGPRIVEEGRIGIAGPGAGGGPEHECPDQGDRGSTSWCSHVDHGTERSASGGVTGGARWSLRHAPGRAALGVAHRVDGLARCRRAPPARSR